LRGPNVDLTLSIKGRIFENSIGIFNMPEEKSSRVRLRTRLMAG
jgi:hypothetical protein